MNPDPECHDGKPDLDENQHQNDLHASNRYDAVIANDGIDGLLLYLYSNSLTIVTYIVHMRHRL